MGDISNIIAKIKKLQALASSSNVNEAAAAAGLANKLLDEYRLSQADLESQGENSFEPVEEDPDYVYQSGKITPWKTSLLRVLSDHYGCVYWNDTHYPDGRKISRYRLVGRRSDIGIIKYMYAFLTLECQRLSEKEAKGLGRVFIASYCQGFVSGVAGQLQTSRVEVQKQSNSTAIVKINARTKESDTAMWKMHPDLRKNKSYSFSQTDPQAFGLGQVQGKSVHLGASITSSGTKLLGR